MGAEKQNQPFRQDYVGVSVTVTNTAQKLTTLIEAMLGLATGALAGAWREVTIQVDPGSTGETVYVGNGNVGQTINGVVQKGVSLAGGADTASATFSNVSIATRWVVTASDTAVLNIQLHAL